MPGLPATFVADVLRWAVFLVMAAAVVGWLDGVRRGTEPLRDEAGRLKPIPAILVIAVALILIGLVVDLIV